MKRTREQIIKRILEICIEGAIKTEIVYKGNLNFRTINPYLEFLTGKGLVAVDKALSLKRKTSVYKITISGNDLLKNLDGMQSQLYK